METSLYFCFNAASSDGSGARAGQRFPIVKRDFRAQRKSPALKIRIVLPSHGQHWLHFAPGVDAHQRLGDWSRECGLDAARASTCGPGVDSSTLSVPP